MSATPLSPYDLRRALATRDLTDPDQGRHAMQLVVADLRQALTGAWACPSRIVHADRIVSLPDNYDHLGYPPDAVTRDARYTRYVDPTHVLRSHSTAMVPGELRRLARAAATDEALADVLLVCPGICYRRDSIDWQHTGEPHQLDLWRIMRGRLDTDDLMDMIGRVVDAVLPGHRWRAEPAVHPYTTNGRQIDVRWDGQWIEIGECGLAAPAVLDRAGLASPPWAGLAMGLGLDRLVMLRKGVPDIRLLRSPDPRVAEQMLDLAPYRPVSRLPAVRRDLSIVVGPTTVVDEELIGDRVRQVLGLDADVAESVAVVSETPYDTLPPVARDRMGIEPGQRNVLIRLVLRPLDRTLTDADANRLRDRVYAALHEGPVAEWASEPVWAVRMGRMSGPDGADQRAGWGG
jgi:phenylalanyl-tRNA synthetase alpha chain